MVFFNFFYTSSGVLSLSIGILCEIQGVKPFIKEALPDAPAMRMILIGSIISVVKFVS